MFIKWQAAKAAAAVSFGVCLSICQFVVGEVGATSVVISVQSDLAFDEDRCDSSIPACCAIDVRRKKGRSIISRLTFIWLGGLVGEKVNKSMCGARRKIANLTAVMCNDI